MIRYFLLILFLTNSLLAETSEHFIADSEKKLNSLLEEKILLSIEKDQLENQILDLQNRIKDRKKLILKRLRSLYSLKLYKWGNFVLNSDLNSLERNLKILNNISRFDVQLFKEYNLSLRNLAAARKNLQDTEEVLKSKANALEKQQREFLALEKLHVDSLTRDKKESLLLLKGHLVRPLVGQLVQSYGTLQDRDDQFFLVSKGERYKTITATSVKALGPGVIIFRDQLSGWRETLVIQHPDNYYSVYAGIKQVGLVVGDKVAMGDNLGTTSSDSFYFELRHFENTINPKSWYRE